MKKRLNGLWRAIAGAAATSLVATGMFATAALPAHAAAGDVSDAELTWSIKSSFVNYVKSPFAQGEVIAEGVQSSDSGFTWTQGTGSVNPDDTDRGEVSFQGGVAFTGHDGALDISIVNPSISFAGSSGEIFADVRSAGFQESPALSADNLHIASFNADVETKTSESIQLTGSSVALTAAGKQVFGDMYEDLDDFTVSLTYSAPVAPEPAPEPEPQPAPEPEVSPAPEPQPTPEPAPAPEPEPSVEPTTPAAPGSPQVKVTPTTIDPAVKNTIKISGTGFDGPAADQGVYALLGKTSLFDGKGPLPAQGWDVLEWIRPNQIVDGAWSVTLEVAAGTLDPASSYEVVTSAAHRLSATERSLDTFTALTFATEDNGEDGKPQVKVTPTTIDPAVKNTIKISGTGFDGPAADQGVYALLGKTSLFDGKGPLPAQGWDVLEWIRPNQIVDGAWSVTLEVPAGTLDPASSYEVVTSAAHRLSATERSLDTFTALTLAAANGGGEKPDTGQKPDKGEKPGTGQKPGGNSGANNNSGDKKPGTCDAQNIDAGTLTWGIMERFRSYVTGAAAHGDISVAGGATKTNANIVTWHSASGAINPDRTGTANFAGSVNFTGHAGVLDLTFENPRIQLTSATTANIVFDVRGTDTSGKNIGGKNLVLATAKFPAIKPGDTVTVRNAATVLTAAGERAFLGNYEPGSSMDPISFTLKLGAATDCVEVPQKVEVVKLPKLNATPTPIPTAPTVPAVTDTGEQTGTTGPTCVANAVSGASLSWGVKSSFRSYIQGPIAQGSVSTSGVTSGANSYTWRGGSGAYNSEASKGSVSFGGTVSFAGHGGQLDMVLSNPRVVVNSAHSATLYVDVRSRSLEGATMNQKGVAFASLSLPQATHTGNTVSYHGASATLTAAGAKAFSGFYDAGAALDPVSFTLPLGGEVECTSATGTLSTTGAPVDGLGLMLGLLLLGGGLIVARNRRAQA